MINKTTLMLSFTLLMVCAGSKSIGKQVKRQDRLTTGAEPRAKSIPKTTQQVSTTLKTGWYYVVDSSTGLKRQLDKSKETYFIDRHPIVTPNNFTDFLIEENKVGGAKYFQLFMQLDNPGTARWALATEKSIGKQFAFILDNQLLYVAPVFAQILNGMTAINRTNYTKEEFETFKRIIKSERFPQPGRK